MPCTGETDNKKGEMMEEAIVASVIMGAEAAWRMHCELAAAAAAAGLAIGQNRRLAAKVDTPCCVKLNVPM